MGTPRGWVLLPQVARCEVVLMSSMRFENRYVDFSLFIALVSRLYATVSWPRLRVSFVAWLNLPYGVLSFTLDQRIADGESSIFKDLDKASLAFTSGRLLVCLASSWPAKCKRRS